ncbi:hypothetical protein U0070_024658 [Myodes glareolus]|uniref:Uncharacterized protein n=1 Tax=Myodes glareolus TaxID=447135 RepID=A0AAW0JY49_MYOGA
MDVGSDHLTEARYVFKAQPTVHQTLSSNCKECLSDVLLRTGAPASAPADSPWDPTSLTGPWDLPFLTGPLDPTSLTGP